MLSLAAEEVLGFYNARNEQELKVMAKFSPSDEGAPDPDTLLLAVGEDTGRLLNTMIVGLKAQHIVEIGTSHGYSTLFLAAAAKKTGGMVTTIELDAKKQMYAEEMLSRAGLNTFVNWCNGDALEELSKLQDGIDFILLDLWKKLYVPCLDIFYPKLGEKAVVVADNILLPTEYKTSMEAYRAAVDAKGDLSSCLLPIGSGLLVSSRL